MKSIKAIVLTYDRYRTITDHMIFRYNKIWPNHPFCFRVPYQELDPTLDMSMVEYIKSPPDIKGTVLALLEDLDDEDMVYWCIDDKYPISLDINKIEALHQWLFNRDAGKSLSGLLFSNRSKTLKMNNLTGRQITTDQGDIFLERTGYRQIWLHQYLKVKVIRHLFNLFPDYIRTAKEMDYLKNQVSKPDSHDLYVTRESLAVFGESTSRGVLTKNCYKSMVKENLSLPTWSVKITDHEIIMGGNCSGKLDCIYKRIMKFYTRRK